MTLFRRNKVRRGSRENAGARAGRSARRSPCRSGSSRRCASHGQIDRLHGPHYINLTVVQGTGGSFSSCSGFNALSSGSSLYSGTLANFGSSATGYSTGLGNWAPTGTASETRSYQISYTVSSSAPDSTQGGTAAIGFTWETQNS